MMGYKILDSGNGYPVMYADYSQGIGQIGQEFFTVHNQHTKKPERHERTPGFWLN